jgi:hypothetical protein
MPEPTRLRASLDSAAQLSRDHIRCGSCVAFVEDQCRGVAVDLCGESQSLAADGFDEAGGVDGCDLAGCDLHDWLRGWVGVITAVMCLV